MGGPIFLAVGFVFLSGRAHVISSDISRGANPESLSAHYRGFLESEINRMGRRVTIAGIVQREEVIVVEIVSTTENV